MKFRRYEIIAYYKSDPLQTPIPSNGGVRAFTRRGVKRAVNGLNFTAAILDPRDHDPDIRYRWVKR